MAGVRQKDVEKYIKNKKRAAKRAVKKHVVIKRTLVLIDGEKKFVSLNKAASVLRGKLDRIPDKCIGDALIKKNNLICRLKTINNKRMP